MMHGFDKNARRRFDKRSDFRLSSEKQNLHVIKLNVNDSEHANFSRSSFLSILCIFHHIKTLENSI